MRRGQPFFFFLIQIILILGFVQVACGQYYISGIIINKETKEPVPFANIAVKDVYRGTASNALGEFSFKTDSLPITLVITHVSFETRNIEVRKEYDRLVVELIPGKLLMDELVVKAKGNDQYAYDLVKRAYYKVQGKGSVQRFGKAFYRQISRNGDDYSELYEIFYDTKFSNNGVEDWAIQEGRYALKLSTIDSFIYNKNFTMLVRLLTVVQPSTDDLVMPVSEKVEEQYFLKTEDVTSVNGRRLARISFEKMETVTIPAMEGEMLIDTESLDILKISGTVADDNLNFITLKGEKGSWKKYQVKCEIAFKPEGDHIVLDYMRLGQNFDYYQNDVFINPVETQAFFTYYEYYEPPKKKRLGGRLMRFNQRDSDILDAVGYNQLFWDENIIVKRTPIESDVIASFEKERAFGSIYLNNKNQVELEDYVVDNDPFIVSVRQMLKKQSLPAQGEKVFLHHDKPQYIAGQTMLWKAYVVNMATNGLIEGPGLLHISLKDPSGKSTLGKSFKIQDGEVNGVLTLPEDLRSGIYQLTANTAFMGMMDDRFVFQENLIILNPAEDSGKLVVSRTDSLKTLLIQPEGGRMVADIPVQLGFVALDEYGQPTDFRGRITDDQGKIATQLKSDYDGFGSTFIMPSKDSKLKVITPSGYKTVSLPDVAEAGYSVMINNLKPNAIDVLVRGTMKFEGKKFYLLFISNGQLIDRRIGVLLKGMFRTEIPKTNFPNGIAQVLLVDDRGSIHCRRLAYLEQPHEAHVNFYLAKKDIAPGEKVDMVLEVNDENGKPIGTADLSVSILNKDKVKFPSFGQNIRSYFDFGYLFDYDIPEPASLLSNNDREGLKNFEFLMLNQKTALPEITSFAANDSVAPAHPVIAKVHISGKARLTDDGSPLVNGYLTVVAYPDASEGSWHVRTDDQGRFLLDRIDFIDSATFYVKGWDKNGMEADVTLDFMHNDGSTIIQVGERAMGDDSKKYLESYRVDERLGFRDIPMATSVSNLVASKSPFYGKPDLQIAMSDRNAKNLLDFFQLREAGTEVRQSGRVLLKNDDIEPLLMVDGVLMNPQALRSAMKPGSEMTLENESVEALLHTTNLQQYDRVEIIRNGRGVSFYGIEWNQGIIMLYSKSGHSMITGDESEAIPLFKAPGFDLPATATQDYAKKPEVAPDLRSTIYWNPAVKVNKKGRVKISFFNSDDARTLQVCVQGMTTSGIPVFELFDIGKGAIQSR